MKNCCNLDLSSDPPLGTSDFDVQMPGLKFWKGVEIQEPFINTRFSKFWAVASIVDFLVHKKYVP